MTTGLPYASRLENARFGLTYMLPSLLRGAIIPQPFWVGVTTRLNTGRWGVATLEWLYQRHGGRSMVVRGVLGDMLLIMTPEDARRVLAAPIDLFAMNPELKTRVFGVPVPNGVITSTGAVRAQRRPFNEAVLGWKQEPHPLTERVLAIVGEEVPDLLADADRRGRILGYDVTREGFRRIFRRCAFGDAARDDTALNTWFATLAADGNWAGLMKWNRRRNAEIRARLDDKIRHYVGAAEPGTLVGMFANAPQGPDTHPAGQVPHWLGGLDLVRAAVCQTLALLASHPAERARVLAEIEAADAEHGHGTVAGMKALSYTRACFQDAVRLWAPIPNLARETSADTDWYGTRLPAGAGVFIPAGSLHRSRRLPQANRFAPDAWLDGSAEDNWLLSPFSRGAGQCPGRDLGLLLGTAIVAELLRQRRFGLLSPKLSPNRPLPYTINPLKIRFAVRERAVTRQVPQPSPGSESRPGRTATSGSAVAGG